LLPAIVTAVPPGPEAGFRLVIEGTVPTAKLSPLLATPPTFTTTLPVVAPLGTLATMLLALQLVTIAVVPLKATELLPWVAPKPLPVIVTTVPTGPDVGFRPAIAGAAVVTVKLTPLLATPPTITTTLPVVAPIGTFTVMLVALQLLAAAALAPLNITPLPP
jgi:hypothetical protein